jgi:hypothetical protein
MPVIDSPERTLAEICVAVGEEMAGKVGLPGGLTETAFAFSIDIDPDEISFLGIEVVRDIAADPLICALCHATAEKLFSMFRIDAVHDKYALAPSDIAADRRRDMRDAFVLLVATIGRITRAGERMVFAVKYANHSFVIATRNRRAEIFQSAMSRYTLGRNVLNNVPYDAEEIESLVDVIGDDEAAKIAQETHFFLQLADDLPAVEFEYRWASLADDDEIRRRLVERMEKSLRFYTSVIERDYVP